MKASLKKVGKMLSKFLHFESYIVQKRINQRIRKLKKGSGEIWRAFSLLTGIQSFIKHKKSCKNHFQLYGQREQILDHYTHENVAQSLNCDFTCATVHYFKLLVLLSLLLLLLWSFCLFNLQHFDILLLIFFFDKPS